MIKEGGRGREGTDDLKVRLMGTTAMGLLPHFLTVQGVRLEPLDAGRNDHRVYLEPELITQRAQGTQDCLPLFSLILLCLWTVSLSPLIHKVCSCVHSVNGETEAQIKAAAQSVPLVAVEVDLGHIL